MHLTRHTDYALRLMIYLELHSPALVTIQEVSEVFSVSRNHLMKIANRLAVLGYVETVRGKGGGVRLARPAESIRLGTVIDELEPRKPLVDCATPVCPIAPSCRLIGIFDGARRAFVAELERFSLEDLTRNRAALAGDLRRGTPGHGPGAPGKAR